MRRKLGLCLLAAALGLLLCAACAEQQLTPGMMMSARESYFEPSDYPSYYGFVPGEPEGEDGGRATRGQVVSITFRSSLAGAPEDAWDMSALGDGSVLAWIVPGSETGDLIIAAEGGVKANPDSSYLFAGYGRGFDALELNFNHSFDCSTAEDLTGMFESCGDGCPDFAQLDTSGAVCMADMFKDSRIAREMDLTSFDTSGVADMSGMFEGCNAAWLDLTSFDTSAAETMDGMFRGATNLAEVAVSERFAAAANAEGMFENCGVDGVTLAAPRPEPELTPGMLMRASDGYRDLHWDSIVPGSDAVRPIRRRDVTRITFQSSLAGAPEDAWDMSALGDGSVLAWAVSEGTFQEEDYLTGEMVDYEFFQLTIAAEGGVKANPDSSYWFAGYSEAEAIDFNDSFSTEGVVDMSYMFYGCYLEELDLSCFDTSAVETMAGMFQDVGALGRVDLSGFDTRACRDMGHMFMDTGFHWLDLTALEADALVSAGGMIGGNYWMVGADVSPGFPQIPGVLQAVETDADPHGRLMVAWPSYSRGEVPGNPALARSEVRAIRVTDDAPGAPGDAWDMSAAGDGSVLAWFADGELTIAADGGVRANRDSCRLFAGYENLERIDLGGLDTSAVADAREMFLNCGAKELDLSGFDTSGCREMSGMFQNCGAEALDLSGFDTSACLCMMSMFRDCGAEALDLTGMDTSACRNMNNMFQSCAARSLDLTSFETGECEQINGFFNYAAALESVLVGEGFDIDANIDSGIFHECGVDHATTVHDASAPAGTLMWAVDDEIHGALRNATVYVPGTKRVRREEVREVRFEGNTKAAPEDAWDMSEAGDGSVLAWFADGELTIAADGGVRANPNSSFLFAYYVNLSNIEFNGNFDTSGVKNFRSLFQGCASLVILDLERFDTSSAENMRSMFFGCSALQKLDVSGFDTSKVEDMRSMFNNCAGLWELDLSNFDTARVRTMERMFCNCDRFTELDLSGFDTARVESMRGMFQGCTMLEMVDLTSFDLSSATNLYEMFRECLALKDIRTGPGFASLPNANTQNMFLDCATSALPE